VLLSAGNRIVGRDAIRAAYEDIFADYGTLSLATSEVIESASGIALLRARWTHRAGTVTRGESIEVVRRHSDGRWLYVLDNPNPA
jgi:ketosteroid isomerase-like protein